jgi:hypothetical protein
MGIRSNQIRIVIALACCIALISCSRTRGSQETGAAGIREINTALIEYGLRYAGFAPTLKALGSGYLDEGLSANAAGLIDSVLASGTKAGYHYRYHPLKPDAKGKYHAYEIYADPVEDPKNNQPHYFTNETGTIRVQIGRPADVNSPLDKQ